VIQEWYREKAAKEKDGWIARPFSFVSSDVDPERRRKTSACKNREASSKTRLNKRFETGILRCEKA
jgi:hypothetical protein